MPTRRGRFSSLPSFRSSGLLVAALLAKAVDLEIVAAGREGESFSDARGHCFDLRRKKLDRVSARRANHVVMGAPVQTALVAGHAVVELDFIRQPCGHE